MSSPLPIFAEIGNEGPRADVLYEGDMSPLLKEVLQSTPSRTAYLDVTVVSANLDNRCRLRLWPGITRQNPTHSNIWHIDEGTCQRLDPTGTPHGPRGTCDGYLSTVPNPGGSAGKLDIDLPEA